MNTLKLNSFIPSFVDRDMLMRYHWGLGIGHVYAHDIVANGVTEGSLSKSTAEEPVILAGPDVELEAQGSAPEPLHVCPTDDADGTDDSDNPEANGVTDGPLSKSTAEEPVILAGLDVELEAQGSAPEPLHICPTDDADGSDDSDNPELGMENRDDDNWDSDEDENEELGEDPYGSDEDTFLSREEMYGQDFDLHLG